MCGHAGLFGPVADVSRFARAFGWSPRPTAQAFDDFADGRIGLLSPTRFVAAEERILDALDRRRTVTQGVVGA